MKSASCILSLLLLGFTCNKEVTAFFPKDYKLADEQIGNGKTLVYQNTSTAEKTYTDLQLVTKEGKNYRCERRYNNIVTTDSIVTVDGKLLEVFEFFTPGNAGGIKGEIILDTVVIKDKTARRQENILFKIGQMRYELKYEEEKLKDTTFMWQGRQVETILIKAVAYAAFKRIGDETVRQSWHIVSNAYHGKGIGMMLNIVETKDQAGRRSYDEWMLTDIKEISEKNSLTAMR
ncbi:hypothetical protein QTN47_26580 [Danxiaibacter flavus]|uniref:GLPGLI family protein n=1 Tax=Danxiaibacter flavus TaxID=3049108 RepID=A0ABV3ZMK8_9BACT|nr:hypothetical protein QNM32_26580 [Chitinophagaceae bacterium DXS]